MAAYNIAKTIEDIESKSVESDLKLVSIRGIICSTVIYNSMLNDMNF